VPPAELLRVALLLVARVALLLRRPSLALLLLALLFLLA